MYGWAHRDYTFSEHHYFTNRYDTEPANSEKQIHGECNNSDHIQKKTPQEVAE